jgi:hypothetical protein
MFFVLKIKIIYFLFFKKLFLKLTHQNDPKHIKKLIFNKKILKTQVKPHFQVSL